MSSRLQIPTKTAASVASSGSQHMALQRTCDCGGVAGFSGSCEGCGREKLLQRRAFSDESPIKSANSSYSTVKPNDATTRAILGIQFGHDFGALRVQPSGPSKVLADDLSPTFGIEHSVFNSHKSHGFENTSLKEEVLDGEAESSDSEQPVAGTRPDEAGATQSEAATLPGMKSGGTSCDVSTGSTVVNVVNKGACTGGCSEAHEQKHSTDIGPCCTKAGEAAKKVEKPEEKEAVQTKFNEWMLSNVNFLECRAYGVSVTCAEKKQKEANCLVSARDQCCSPVGNYLRSSRVQKESTCNHAGQALSACPFT